jgi:Protein of unknown function (DUF3175)
MILLHKVPETPPIPGRPPAEKPPMPGHEPNSHGQGVLYVNRTGKTLPQRRVRVLERAKDELRALFRTKRRPAIRKR